MNHPEAVSESFGAGVRPLDPRDRHHPFDPSPSRWSAPRSKSPLEIAFAPASEMVNKVEFVHKLSR